MARNQFFQKLEGEWDSASGTRRSYAQGIPVPSSSYFDPIDSIDQLAHLLVRPIEKPLWLGFNAIGYLLKAMLNAVGTLVLAPVALVANILAPKTNFTSSINSAFCSAAANTFASIGMCLLAAVSAVASLIFNPLFIAGRVIGTVFEGIQEATRPCFG